MTGKQMRELIESGTCPNCGSALSSTNHVGKTFLGSCDPCNINWLGRGDNEGNQIEAERRWAKK